MTSVSICNDGPQEVGVGNAATARFGSRDSLFPLLAVVEKLGQEQLLDLVGNSILQIFQDFI